MCTWFRRLVRRTLGWSMTLVSFRNWRENPHQHPDRAVECTAAADCQGVSSDVWAGTAPKRQSPVSRIFLCGALVDLWVRTECGRRCHVHPLRNQDSQSWFASHHRHGFGASESSLWIEKCRLRAAVLKLGVVTPLGSNEPFPGVT